MRACLLVSSYCIFFRNRQLAARITWPVRKWGADCRAWVAAQCGGGTIRQQKTDPQPFTCMYLKWYIAQFYLLY